MSLADEVNRAMLFPRDGFPQGWDFAPRGNVSAAEAGFAAGGPIFDADALNAARADVRNAAINARRGGGIGRLSIRKRKLTRKELARLRKSLRDRLLANPGIGPDPFDILGTRVAKGKPLYSDPIAEEARQKVLGNLEPVLNLLALRGSRADIRLRPRPRTPGRSFPGLQKGFLAPAGVRPPPAAPAKVRKPPAEPPKPPPRRPPPPRTAPPPVPGPAGKVRKVPVRAWEGAPRVPVSWKTGRELEKAVGIQTRVKVGKGLEVLLPPQARLDVVNKAQRALDKARDVLGKLDFFKARAPFKLKPARPFFPAKAPPAKSPLPDLQRVIELVRPRRGLLDLPPGVKEPGDSLLDPARPGLDTPRLTQPQEAGLRSRGKSCECPEVKPKKKRLSCRQGYFRETSRGITYKTWSTRKCPV